MQTDNGKNKKIKKEDKAGSAGRATYGAEKRKEIAEFEAGYDAIVQTATKEYEDDPPSEYYRDGYDLYLRMVEYKRNHLLFLSNPLVDPDNNLCERNARISRNLKKQNLLMNNEGLIRVPNYHTLFSHPMKSNVRAGCVRSKRCKPLDKERKS